MSHETSKLIEERDRNLVVFKMEIHCDGCALKIKRAIKKNYGVHKVNIDIDEETIKVRGDVDANIIKEKLEEKFKTNVEIVEIVSPVEKKDKEETKEHHDDHNRENNEGSSSMSSHIGNNQYSSMNYYMGNNQESSMNFNTKMFSDDNPNACVLM